MDAKGCQRMLKCDAWLRLGDPRATPQSSEVRRPATFGRSQGSPRRALKRRCEEAERVGRSRGEGSYAPDLVGIV